MRDDHVIFGVHVQDRVKDFPNIQKLFTEYGCSIKTRIGSHHVDENVCSPRGLILLEMFGDEAQCSEVYNKLGAEGNRSSRRWSSHTPREVV